MKEKQIKKSGTDNEPRLFMLLRAVMLLLILIFLLSGGLAFSGLHTEAVNIRIHDTAVRAEIVSTEEERRQGLSGRNNLREGRGMLFVFEEEGHYSFWMKDMRFPIDIIWISAEKRIVHIEHTVTPDSYPDSFASPATARYVLEVPAGFAMKHEIRVGDTAQWR